jgi:hypothetical protein
MVAAVRNAQGELVALHRTWVTHAGQKAPFDPVKMVFGPSAKAAIWLADGRERLVVGEGIETTYAAAMRLDEALEVTPVAALHAVGLASFEPPLECADLWVAVDMDPKGKTPADIFGTHDRKGRIQFGSTGVEAAFQLMRRARARGIAVHALVPYGKDHAG